MQFSWVNAALDPVPKQWHQQLVRVMSSGDPDAADAAMRKHVRYGNDHLLETLLNIQAEEEERRS